MFGVSGKPGPGTLLLGGELSHDNGPWTHPDNFLKADGLLS